MGKRVHHKMYMFLHKRSMFAVHPHRTTGPLSGQGLMQRERGEFEEASASLEGVKGFSEEMFFFAGFPMESHQDRGDSREI